MAVVGVGNKKTDYDESDVNQIVLFMDCMWLIIKTQRVETQFKSIPVAD